MSVSSTNQDLLVKSEALKKIHEHARDYLSVSLTLPLGDKALKNVHTNQWLFTELPKEFDLANWTIIADALKSSVDRYEGYVANRWYIEGVDINVDASGKAEMKLSCNAFASSYSNFNEDYKSITKAYTDATTKKTTTTKNTTTKNKSTAVKANNTKLFATKAGKNISSNLTNAAKAITKDCNTEEQKAYCIYDWVDKYVSYEYYYNSKYSSEGVISGHSANCWDTAFLIYNLCSKVKVRCEVYNGYYHFLDGTYGHLWNKIPYKGKMTFADTGRSGRNPIGNHGSGRYIVSGGGSPYRKNY